MACGDPRHLTGGLDRAAAGPRPDRRRRGDPAVGQWLAIELVITALELVSVTIS